MISECSPQCLDMACYSRDTHSCKDYFSFIFDAGTDPFTVLGMKSINNELHVRVWLPDASRVWLVNKKNGRRIVELEADTIPGFFITILKRRKKPFDYILELEHNGHTEFREDPYRFREEVEKYRSVETSCIYDVLGAHLIELNGCQGIMFSVRFATARQVFLTGFFAIQGKFCHPMKLDEKTGVWTLFMPGEMQIPKYSYRILYQNGETYQVSDPYAQATDLIKNQHYKLPPTRTGFQHPCQVKNTTEARPVNVTILASNSKDCDIESMTDTTLLSKNLASIKAAGFTHLAILPPAKWNDSNDISKQILNPGPAALCQLAHRNGLNVIMNPTLSIDAATDLSYAPVDGKILATCHKSQERQYRCLIDNAHFWLIHSDLDGFINGTELLLCREDMRYGSHILPYVRNKGKAKPSSACVITNKLNLKYSLLPHLPEPTPWLDNYTLNKNTLMSAFYAFLSDRGNKAKILKDLIDHLYQPEAWNEIFILPDFDSAPPQQTSVTEQAALRAIYAFLWLCPMSKMYISSLHEVASNHCGIPALLSDLNFLARTLKLNNLFPVHKWITSGDKSLSLLAYYHQSHFEKIIIICNAGAKPVINFPIRVNKDDDYKEIINTDSYFYGGENRGNAGCLSASEENCNEAFIYVTVPSYTTLYLRRTV